MIFIEFKERTYVRYRRDPTDPYISVNHLAGKRVEINHYHDDMFDDSLLWCYDKSGKYFIVKKENINLING